MSNSAIITTTNNVSYADGQCGAFANLFIDVLKMQGIHNQNNYVRYLPLDPISSDNEFLVKEWSIPSDIGLSSQHGGENYTHRNALRAGFNSSTNQFFIFYQKPNDQAFAWVVEEVIDEPGIEGIGISYNPKSFFENHQIARIKLSENPDVYKYYDPSYGKSFDSLQDIEDEVIVGYVYATLGLVNESNPLVDCDCNLDGDKQDNDVYCYVMYIRDKQSSEPINIKEEINTK